MDRRDKNRLKRDKRLGEIELARRFLDCIGEDPMAWSLQHGDRPDFKATSPLGITVGLEVTQLLPRGDERGNELRLCRLLKSTVHDEIRRRGGLGATIGATNHSVPKRTDDLSSLGLGLRRHLVTHGQGLDQDHGEVKEVFRHPWGEVTWVSRHDARPGVGAIESWGGKRLPHKAWLLQAEIEQLVLGSVMDKVAKVGGYDTSHPLWLAVCNTNDVLRGLSPSASSAIRRLNAGQFARICVFHCPMDVLDARPLSPRFVDVV